MAIRLMYSRFCVLRPADPDRVAAQERRELRGREPEVDRRHPLADATDVERAAAHAPVLEGHEQQLDAEPVAGRHPAHELLWELVTLVEFDQQRIGKLALGEVVDRRQRDVQYLEIELVGHESAPVPSARFHVSLGHPSGRCAIGRLPPTWAWELRIRGRDAIVRR